MNRILTLYNRLFVLWIIIGALVAYYLPHLLIPLKPYMDWFFALTMFGVGMVLQPDDFVTIIKRIKIVIIGVAAQFSVMPLCGFLIAWLFNFNNEFSLGLILTGAAPGAMASNILSYLAGADVAYSVSLTTASTMLAPVMTPLLTFLLANIYLDVPFWAMFISVSKMVLIPLITGIAINHYCHQQVKPFEKIFPAISTTFIAFVCALVIALNHSYLPQIDIWIFLAVIVLNLGGLSIGYYIGYVSKFPLKRKRALSIEIGMQNAGLGSVLALKHFNAKTALPAVIFVFICIFTASILVPLWAKTDKH
jgi:BASS family bile acid:Na+ symporter